MTTISSPQVELGATVAELNALVEQPASLAGLLPSDKVMEFQSTETGCSFKIAGGISIHLGLEKSSEGKPVRYSSLKGTPIRFHLDLIFSPLQGDGMRSIAEVVCEADLNPFTRMMAEKALTQLFETIAENLQATYP
jgi:hypothetical protein